MDSKKCFRCKIEKPLSEFDVDRMKYQLKNDKGTCKVCKDCEFQRALELLSVCRFNFETEKFEVIKFKDIKEVYVYFNREQ